MNGKRTTSNLFHWFVSAFLIGLVLIYRNEQLVLRTILPTNGEYDSMYTMRGTNGNTASLIETMQVPTFSSKVRFFVLLGLEGTGHHAIHQIADGSPIATKLEQLNLLRTHMRALSSALFDIKSGGLLSLHCANNVGSGHELHNHERVSRFDTIVKDDDYQHYISKVADVLNLIQNNFAANNASDWIVPINGFINGLSYPNEMGPCRTQNYPNLDLIYQACAAAKVDCFHVLIYRNPYSIIKSTFQKRKINPTVLGAVHLYTNMLQVIWSQLLMHPSRTQGCLGFFDGHNNITTQHWRDRIRTLFSWDMNPADEERYESFIDRTINNNSELLTPDQQDEIVPRKYDPIMQTFIRLHNNVVSLCYEQYQKNQNGRNKL